MKHCVGKGFEDDWMFLFFDLRRVDDIVLFGRTPPEAAELDDCRGLILVDLVVMLRSLWC